MGIGEEFLFFFFGFSFLLLILVESSSDQIFLCGVLGAQVAWLSVLHVT